MAPSVLVAATRARTRRTIAVATVPSPRRDNRVGQRADSRKAEAGDSRRADRDSRSPRGRSAKTCHGSLR